jgi:hypothetical protein
MVLMIAGVVDPCWNGPEVALLVAVVVAYPPAGIGHIMLFLVAMVKSL